MMIKNNKQDKIFIIRLSNKPNFSHPRYLRNEELNTSTNLGEYLNDHYHVSSRESKGCDYTWTSELRPDPQKD